MQKLQKSFFLKWNSPYFFFLKRFFSRRGEKITEKADKDLTKVQTISEQIKEDHKEFITSFSPKDFRPLSEAPYDRTKKFGERFMEDKKKLNKILRTNYKKVVTTRMDLLAKEALDAHETANLPESRRENLRKVEEIKQFNKVFFQKNEILRQLRKQELSAENFLPIGNLNNDSLVLDLRNRFLEYKENLNNLKNNRIDNFLNHPSENKKLALLLKSGLLDNEKNITEIIMKSGELLHLKTNSTNNSDNNLVQQLTSNNTNMDNNEDVVNKELALWRKADDFENDKDLYFSMIKNMGFQLDQNLTQYDFEKLALFFENIIKVDQTSSQKLLENFTLIKKIKSFENYLFENIFNNQLDIRVKRGRALFKDLTEKESLNYVKYNIENLEDLFKMFDNSVEIHNVKLISTMIQKISLFQLKKDHSILYIISDNRYAAILRYIATNINLLNNVDFVSTIWALSKIHIKERGAIYPRIFKVLASKIKNEISNRIDSFNNDEFSFLCRGLINFPLIDVTKKEETIEKILENIEKKIENTNNLFCLQGFNLFLSLNPSEKSFLLLQKSFEILTKNQSFVSSFDEKDIMDICYFYSKFLNIKNESDSKFIQQIKNFFESNSNLIMNYVDKFTIDEISSIFVFFTKLNFYNKDVVLSLRKKMVESLRDYQRFRDISLPKFSVSLVYFDFLRKKKLHAFELNNFLENMIINSLFPGFLHKPSSPIYTPYNEIAKIIADYKHKIKERWIVSTVFSLAAANYRNENFYEMIFNYLLEIKPTNDLKTLIYLILTVQIIGISPVLQTTLKDMFISEISRQQTKKLNPTLCANLVIIFNLFFQEPPKINFDRIYHQILSHLKFFSNEFLILLAWSFIFSDKNPQNQEFLQNLSENLSSKLNEDFFKEKPSLVYLCNQLLYLKNLEIPGWKLNSNEVCNNFYKAHELNIEELEFYRGKRFSTKFVKEQILSFFTQENLIPKKDIITNSNIKIDFLFEEDKFAVNVFSGENFCLNWNEEKILRPVFKNEIEILEKHHGFKVLIICSDDYLNVGSNMEKLDDEKNEKKKYLKKLLKSYI